MRLPKIELTHRNRILAGTLIIALSIPLTLLLIRMSQELRRRAAGPTVKNYTLYSTAESDGYLEKRAEFYGAYPGSCGEAYRQATGKTPTVHSSESEAVVGAMCMSFGQGRYWLRRMYLSFDTSQIPPEETITSARLCVTVKDNYSSLSSGRELIDVDVYRHLSADPGTLTAADWDGSGDPYEGRLINGMTEIPRVSNSTYYLPVDPTRINRSGPTEYRLNAADEMISRDDENDVAHWTRFLPFYTGESAAYPPCLEITTAAPPPPTAAIQGVVFDDLNGNQTRDEIDPGMTGVSVTLKDDSGIELTSATTDANGQYSFNELQLGSYTVSEQVPDGYTATTPVEVTVGLTQGGETKVVNFGNRAVPPPQRGKISGYKFQDLNGNGVWDTGEPPYTESPVVITLRAEGAGGPGVDDLTDDAGYFEFTDLEPGNYEVSETVPENWRPTTRNPQTVTLAAGEEKEVNFGNVFVAPQKARIFGHSFLDANENGQLDSGELGLGGVLITLKDSEGNALATTPTAEGTDVGFFSFADLSAGTYTVAETVPEGFTATTPSSLTVTLAAGENKPVDFGNTEAAGGPQGPVCESLTATPQSGDAPLAVSFSVAAFDTNGGTVAEYRYDFGDGSGVESATSATATHTYENAGSYTAVVTVVDDQGNRATSSGCRAAISVTEPETPSSPPPTTPPQQSPPTTENQPPPTQSSANNAPPSESRESAPEEAPNVGRGAPHPAVPPTGITVKTLAAVFTSLTIVALGVLVVL
jgi:PKD repeat protein